jgi:glycine oxidase
VAQAITESLRRRAVPVHRHCRIERVEPRRNTTLLHGAGFTIECGLLVIAGGAWSGSLEGLPRLPVRPVRGQMIAYDGLSWQLRGRVRHRHYYAVLDRSDHSLLVGATVEEAGFDAGLTEDGRLDLMGFAQELLPRLRWKAVSRHWSGLRPGTVDGLPILGRYAESPVLYATGHYRNGILLAPWTASAVADAVLRGQALEPSWSPQRFEQGDASPRSA